MKRLFILAVAAVFGLGVAACAPAGAAPTWTFSPAASSAAVVEPTVAPPEPTVAATPTPVPPTAPPALGTVDAPRVIEVTMGNFFYEPGAFTVQLGETIRFVVHNPTTIAHELVLGTAEEQEHHAMEMMDGMDHHDMGDEPNEIEVEAGEDAELVWTFDEAGEILMGCHVAGHWEGGMQATITVTS